MPVNDFSPWDCKWWVAFNNNPAARLLEMTKKLSKSFYIIWRNVRLRLHNLAAEFSPMKKEKDQ